MSFRLRHTAYRGITFRFERNFKQAYLFYGLPVFLFLALLVSSIYFSVPSEVWEYSEVPISEEMPADETTEIPAVGEEAKIDIEEEFNMPWGLAALFPLFILGFPFWQYLKAIFLVNNARYGTSTFSYGAVVKLSIAIKIAVCSNFRPGRINAQRNDGESYIDDPNAKEFECFAAESKRLFSIGFYF
ncbi:hypothetical protein A3740_25405 [Oleiphilus sp. HI0068]|nr:hypothetical protein A3740_25405 [Oleiphilus sp. HI0068]